MSADPISNQADQSEFSEHKNESLQNENKEDKVEVTPRKRKPQRALENIDQFLDNVDTSKLLQNRNKLRKKHKM